MAFPPPPHSPALPKFSRKKFLPRVSVLFVTISKGNGEGKTGGGNRPWTFQSRRHARFPPKACGTPCVPFSPDAAAPRTRCVPHTEAGGRRWPSPCRCAAPASRTRRVRLRIGNGVIRVNRSDNVFFNTSKLDYQIIIIGGRTLTVGNNDVECTSSITKRRCNFSKLCGI